MPSSPQHPPSKVQHIRITRDEAGQRIDNFLMRRLKGVPKSHIYRILRKGEVRVNKKRIKPEYKLIADDEMRLPPVRYSEHRKRCPPDTVLKRVESRIIYEDDRVMVLNKPSGLAVHAGSGVNYGVIDALRSLQPGKPLFLAHRLDRETSGCLLIARDRPAMLSLHKAIHDGEVDKYYTALLMGNWGRGKQIIDIPLQRNGIRDGRRLIQADEKGKRAVSIFYPLREYAGGEHATTATLMKIRLVTGRTHQIRIHAREIGHPLAGDRRYGNGSFNQEMQANGLQRIFLHAWSVDFPHPDDGRKTQIESPLDEDLQQVLNRLSARKIIRHHEYHKAV